MAPQHHDDHKTRMNQLNHHHEEDLDDAEHLTEDEPPSSSQSSPEDLFRYIDQQHSNVKSQLEACEAKRKEIVREMAQHMLTLESDDDDDDDDDDSVCRRHAELTIQLSAIKREQKKLKKKFAGVKLLSDKRNDVETIMRTRLKAASSGGPNNFSVEELHQIIESQAFATLEVEILNQERNLLEVQLIESKKQTERLQLQCSEKDERIKLLKQQNESYQHELARLHSESPVSSQVSVAEMTQISSLRYNLQAENQYIRKRLTFRTSSNLESPQVSTFTSSTSSLSTSSSIRPAITTTPPTTVQISSTSHHDENSATPQITNHKKTDDDADSNIKGVAMGIRANLGGDQGTSGEDMKQKEEEEKKLLQKEKYVLDEAAKEKERFLREQYLKHESREEDERKRIEQQRTRQQQRREEWVRDEAAKEEERRIRELQEQLQVSRQTQEDIEQKRKRQQQKREQLARDEAAKEEEKKMHELQQQLQVSRQTQEDMEEKRKRQLLQKRDNWIKDEAAKEEEKKIRELQAQLRMSRQAQAQQPQVIVPRQQVAQEDNSAAASHPGGDNNNSAGRLASIPENEERRASLDITNYQRQARRQAERLASRSTLSPTPSTRGTISSRSVRSPTPTSPESLKAGLSRSLHYDTKSLDDGNNDDNNSKHRAYNNMAKSAHGGIPGAMRMAATGTLQEEASDESYDDDDNSDSDDSSSFASGNDSYIQDAMNAVSQRDSGGYTVTATLVKDDDGRRASLTMSDRERRFAERERELEAREAEVAKQASSFHSLTAEVVPAVAIATISRNGSYRETKEFRESEASLGISFASGPTLGEEGVLGDLSPGALRFDSKERPLRTQFQDMSDNDYYCFSQIQERWEMKRKQKGGAPYSETIILRFLRNTCKKDGTFNVPKAWKAMKKTKERNLFLSAGKLEKQLLTATLFPVPGLLSNAGFEMFYMKPCRFHRKDSVRDVIDNLVYVINCMLEKEGNAKNGIGFMACMNDWKMSNFEVNYCYQFMMALQSMVVPVSVELFLIVNPPSWFGGIWKIMKPMLAPSFRKKVKVIKEAMLESYLMEGYEDFLPDDFDTGTVDTFQLARDFVSYRKHVEFGNVQLTAKSACTDDDDKSQFSGSTRSGDERMRGGLHNKTYRTMDASSHSFRSSSDSEGVFGSAYGSSSHEVENEDDDASIHCSIDGSADDEGSMDMHLEI